MSDGADPGPQQTPQVVAGWYDDGQGKQRWHDGTNWTEQVQKPQKVKEEGASSPLAGTVSRKVAAIVGGAALVLGLIIGACATPAPSTEPLLTQIGELETDVSRAENGRSSAEKERDRAEERANSAITELDQREAAVAAREEAVQVTEDTIAANSFPGNGVYIVGTDITPGTYRSEGSGQCYWARLNITGDDIIDNNISAGQSIVTVQAGDGLLEVSGCGEFTKVG